MTTTTHVVDPARRKATKMSDCPAVVERVGADPAVKMVPLGQVTVLLPVESCVRIMVIAAKTPLAPVDGDSVRVQSPVKVRTCTVPDAWSNVAAVPLAVFVTCVSTSPTSIGC